MLGAHDLGLEVRKSELGEEIRQADRRPGLGGATPMGPLRRFLDRLSESDEARLAAEVATWAETVPGTVRIGGADARVG